MTMLRGADKDLTVLIFHKVISAISSENNMAAGAGQNLILKIFLTFSEMLLAQAGKEGGDRQQEVTISTPI